MGTAQILSQTLSFTRFWASASLGKLALVRRTLALTERVLPAYRSSLFTGPRQISQALPEALKLRGGGASERKLNRECEITEITGSPPAQFRGWGRWKAGQQMGAAAVLSVLLVAGLGPGPPTAHTGVCNHCQNQMTSHDGGMPFLSYLSVHKMKWALV